LGDIGGSFEKSLKNHLGTGQIADDLGTDHTITTCLQKGKTFRLQVDPLDQGPVPLFGFAFGFLLPSFQIKAAKN
jgi:hypothetical protein